MPNHRSSSDAPLVSAVIPTRDRPDFLACAIRSAFRQTWLRLEVIVVVDGPDAATVEYLGTVHDPRLRVIFLSERCGGSDARNAGVHAACGEWIAFLDDDDEWLPEKIERQMRAAHAMPDWFPVVSCRLIAQSPTTSRVLPPRIYRQPEPIADFLFCRSYLRDPGGILQSSTLLAPRELLLAVPFESGLQMHQDTDWVIRVGSHKGVGFTMLPQPLSIWRVGDQRAKWTVAEAAW
jgi:glycosyltransferase involved in cell wall biosynthesis